MRIMLSCKRVSELLSQAQERPLGPLERAGVNVHLAICRGCRNFAGHLRFLRAAVKRYLGRHDAS